MREDLLYRFFLWIHPSSSCRVPEYQIIINKIIHPEKIVCYIKGCNYSQGINEYIKCVRCGSINNKMN